MPGDAPEHVPASGPETDNGRESNEAACALWGTLQRTCRTVAADPPVPPWVRVRALRDRRQTALPTNSRYAASIKDHPTNLFIQRRRGQHKKQKSTHDDFIVIVHLP
jgi:hypothetical protein